MGSVSLPAAMLALALLIMALFALNSVSSTSAEVEFKDPSHSGLPIVPASCPSSPDYSGQCDPAASCSVSIDSNPIVNGIGTYVRWTSSYATSYVYLNNIGYVAGSGSAYVAPSATTDYSCIAYGVNGSDGWHSAILTVYQNCTFNGAPVAHGSSVTAYQASVVPFGSICVSQARLCSNGSLSGSYAYSSCSVTPPAQCTLDGATIQHGESRNFYSYQIAPLGQLCSAVSQSRSCYDGTLSGTDTYQYASCSCAPIYYCASGTITYRNSSCSDSAVRYCAAPAYCSDGSSVCLYPDVQFNTTTNTSGHLQAKPLITAINTPTKLFWDVTNVASCTVSGDNGDSWSLKTSGASGKATSPITGKTVYTLTCAAYEGHTFTPESITVNVAPIFNEQ